MAAINRRVVLGLLGAAALSPGPALAQGNKMQSWGESPRSSRLPGLTLVAGPFMFS